MDEDEKIKTATVNLSKEDYYMAIKAHGEGSYVEIIGELSDSIVPSCEAFNIIE